MRGLDPVVCASTATAIHSQPFKAGINIIVIIIIQRWRRHRKHGRVEQHTRSLPLSNITSGNTGGLKSALGHKIGQLVVYFLHVLVAFAHCLFLARLRRFCTPTCSGRVWWRTVGPYWFRPFPTSFRVFRGCSFLQLCHEGYGLPSCKCDNVGSCHCRHLLARSDSCTANAAQGRVTCGVSETQGWGKMTNMDGDEGIHILEGGEGGGRGR